MALVPFPTHAQRRPDDDPDWDDGQLEDSTEAGKMSFLDHLDELRKRIIWAVGAVGAGFLVACFFIQPIFDFIMKPLQAQLPPGQTLVYTEPTEAFVLYIKMAAIAGVMLASPVVMTQVWLFIAPGLYQHEKKFAVPFVVLSTFFFISGAAFSHYVVFPLTWQFFVSFSSDTVTFMPRIEPTFSMYLKMLLGMGLVFQMPTIVLFMARMGVLTARFLVKNFKYAVLIIFIVAAVVTPGQDPTSQIAMAGPMLVLYGISIILAWLFGKKKRTKDDTEAPASE
jgi:sec-independent protein translocase protein TatC